MGGPANVMSCGSQLCESDAESKCHVEWSEYKLSNTGYRDAGNGLWRLQPRRRLDEAVGHYVRQSRGRERERTG